MSEKKTLEINSELYYEIIREEKEAGFILFRDKETSEFRVFFFPIYQTLTHKGWYDVFSDQIPHFDFIGVGVVAEEDAYVDLQVTNGEYALFWGGTSVRKRVGYDKPKDENPRRELGELVFNRFLDIMNGVNNIY